MALADITNPRDLPRLYSAFREARLRNEQIIPPLDDLLPAVRKAVEQEGDLVENLTHVFGEPIRRGFDTVKGVLSEKYGPEYTEDLWQRFLRKEPHG